MIHILYITEKFKASLSSLIKNNSLIPNKEIVFINIAKFHNKTKATEQLIMELLDKSTGFILEFSENNRKTCLMLLISLKLVGLPGVVSSFTIKNPINKALLSTIRNYTTMRNKKLLTQLVKKVYKNAKNIKSPIKTLKSNENFIEVTTPQHTKIYYIYPRRYNPNKPTLIFTHGITARAITYTKLLSISQDYYNVFAIDLPYHGRSSTLSHYPKTLNEYAQIVTKAVHKIIINHKLYKNKYGVHLMGHSLGGAVMLYAAHKLIGMHNIRHLYLLNPAGGPIKQNTTKLIYLTTAYKFLNINKYYVLNNDLKRVIMEVLMNHLKNLNAKTPKMVKEFSSIIPKGFVNFESMIIKVPTTLVFANNDSYFSCEYKYGFAQHFKNLHIIEVKGSHDWPVIKPELIKNILEKSSVKHPKFGLFLHKLFKLVKPK